MHFAFSGCTCGPLILCVLLSLLIRRFRLGRTHIGIVLNKVNFKTDNKINHKQHCSLTTLQSHIAHHFTLEQSQRVKLTILKA